MLHGAGLRVLSRTPTRTATAINGGRAAAPEAESGRWQRDFRVAWQEIESQHALYAPALAAGLTTLMPLAAVRRPRGQRRPGRRSAPSPRRCRPIRRPWPWLLIQEFQHVKLGAILDLFRSLRPGRRPPLSLAVGRGQASNLRDSCRVPMRTWR